MTCFMMKMDDDSFDLLVVGLHYRFNVLSTLFVKDFHFMIYWLEKLLTLKGSFATWYQFPHYSNRPEIVVRMCKMMDDNYQLVLNLGSEILSEMDTKEFTQLIYELKDLVSQFNGSKVYFPTAKDIFKDDK